jgi:hypothetical protein
MKTIEAKPVAIHPRTAAGQAVYARDITAFNQVQAADSWHGFSEDYLYLLLLGMVLVGSGMSQVRHREPLQHPLHHRHEPPSSRG